MRGFKYTGFAVAAFGILCLLPNFARSDNSRVPLYKVDPFWPKQLPNNWMIGSVGGLSIDSHNNIWVLQRPRSLTETDLAASQTPPTATCCVTTPAVLEFDADGKLLRSWGGTGYVPDWPTTEHAIHVDYSGNVWISGNGADDRQVIKFSTDGHELLEIGSKSRDTKNNLDTSKLGRAAGIDVDDANHEVYVADGYLNNRVMVYDSETGKFKRGWGAYGVRLDQISNDKSPPYIAGAPPSKQFNLVHCVTLSADGLVYVCDRINDRIQVFTKEGKFVKEFFVHPATLGLGSIVSVTFSHDKAQKYLIAADAGDGAFLILRRDNGDVVSETGHKGRNAGQFVGLHQIAVDSKGNLYAGEASGERIQKFVLQPEGR